MGMFDKLKKSVLGGAMMDLVTGQSSADSGRKFGYELVCRGNNTSMMPAGMIWLKDGCFYHTPASMFSVGAIGTSFSEEAATPIEITGVYEITKNAKLVALEVRYRINGAINSMQVTELVDTLLTIEGTLLNRRYAAAPEFEETDSTLEEKPIFCGQCGARNTNSANYCTSCGTPVRRK